MVLPPEWLMTPVLAAILAALGYVFKLLIEELTKWRSRRDKRRSKLEFFRSRVGSIPEMRAAAPNGPGPPKPPIIFPPPERWYPYPARSNQRFCSGV
jgi:hypothetical protein